MFSVRCELESESPVTFRELGVAMPRCRSTEPDIVSLLFPNNIVGTLCTQGRRALRLISTCEIQTRLRRTLHVCSPPTQNDLVVVVAHRSLPSLQLHTIRLSPRVHAIGQPTNIRECFSNFLPERPLDTLQCTGQRSLPYVPRSLSSSSR